MVAIVSAKYRDGLDLHNEWYTRPVYADAARSVMGSITLDPASCAAANENIGATYYYSLPDDGLTLPLYGNVFCNPPYGKHASGKSNVSLWLAHLISAYKSGEVNQAIFITMVDTEGLWFPQLWQFPICFPSPRTTFLRPDGKLCHHIQGSCFVYMGPNTAAFRTVFGRFGHVAVPEQEGAYGSHLAH